MFVHIQYGSTPYPTSLMVEILLGNRLYPLVCSNSFQLRSSDWQNKGGSLRKQIISSESDLQPNNNIKIQVLRNSKAEWFLQCCLPLILDSWLHSSATLKMFDFPKTVMNCHQHKKYNIFPLMKEYLVVIVTSLASFSGMKRFGIRWALFGWLEYVSAFWIILKWHWIKEAEIWILNKCKLDQQNRVANVTNVWRGKKKKSQRLKDSVPQIETTISYNTWLLAPSNHPEHPSNHIVTRKTTLNTLSVLYTTMM